MCDMTHSHVWHDSFTCVTWLIHMCDMTHPYVRHDSFFLTDWQIFDSIYPIRCGFNLYILQSLISKSLRLYLYLTDLYNSTRCVFYESVHVPIKEDLSSIRLWIYSSFVCCWCATHCNTLQHTATHCNTLWIYSSFVCCWCVLQHSTGFARLVWGDLGFTELSFVNLYIFRLL